MNLTIRHLNIEVTRRCNQRCFYCFNDSGLGSLATELAPELWLRILGRLKARGLESIHLTGGEPFVYKYSVDLLAGAQGMGLKTSILSNGFRIRELTTQHPEVFRNLVVAQISLDSMNQETHNCRRRHSQAWKDAIEAISTLCGLGVPVEVSCVVCDANLSDLRGVAGFCQENNMALLIRPLIAAGRAAESHLPQAFYRDLQDYVEMLRRKNTVRLATDRFQYVPGPLADLAAKIGEGVFTAHCDGRLRSGGGDPLHLLSLPV